MIFIYRTSVHCLNVYIGDMAQNFNVYTKIIIMFLFTFKFCMVPILLLLLAPLFQFYVHCICCDCRCASFDGFSFGISVGCICFFFIFVCLFIFFFVHNFWTISYFFRRSTLSFFGSYFFLAASFARSSAAVIFKLSPISSPL